MKKTIYALLWTAAFLFCAFKAKAQIGNAINFDGVNDYIEIIDVAGSTSELSLTTGTFEAWIQARPTPSFAGIVVRNQGVGLFLNAGVLTTYDWGGGAEKSTNINIADAYWHHVAMSFVSGMVNGTKFYIDGVLVATTTITIIAPAYHDITIGSGSGVSHSSTPGQFFNGDIDEVRIWNVVRTAAQINAAKNTELLGTETGLASYYKFNQGVPSGNNPTVTTLIDAVTASANPGTLSNFSLTPGKYSNWIDVSTPLPVELLSFKATPQYENVKLTWQIDHSINNKGFQIERLNEARQDWEIIGFVEDAAKKTAYDYVDNTFSTNQNVHYYRLRQIDNDGDEHLSKIVSVATKGEKGLKIYPTLVSDGLLTLELTGKAPNTEGSRFQIVNLLGQPVQSGTIAETVDVSALPRGTYIVTVGLAQAKFVKQ